MKQYRPDEEVYKFEYRRVYSLRPMRLVISQAINALDWPTRRAPSAVLRSHDESISKIVRSPRHMLHESAASPRPRARERLGMPL